MGRDGSGHVICVYYLERLARRICGIYRAHAEQLPSFHKGKMVDRCCRTQSLLRVGKSYESYYILVVKNDE
jgi:hypothetical protein